MFPQGFPVPPKKKPTLLATYSVSVAVASIDVPIPQGFSKHIIEFNPAIVSSAGSHLFLQFSPDAGATFDSTIGSYQVVSVFGNAVAGGGINAPSGLAPGGLSVSTESLSAGSSIYACVELNGLTESDLGPANRLHFLDARYTNAGGNACYSRGMVRYVGSLPNKTVTKIRITPSSGNISASSVIRLWGIE